MTAPSHDEPTRAKAPDAREIERRFRTPAVRAARPVILASLKALGLVRGFRWRAEGIERLPANGGPVIFAANHCSHADTAAILGTLPTRLRRRTCVAAALDVFGPASEGGKTLKGFRRECLQVCVAAGFHAFAFDRHGPPHRSLRTAVDLVRNGWSLLLYPEGTRSRTGELGPFKPGVGVLARATRCPVIPVHVSGGRTVLPCGAFFPRSGEIVTRFGTPLNPRDRESAREFCDRLRPRLLDLACRNEFGAARIEADEPAPLAAVPPVTGDVRKQSA